jgi:hypothetical protein
MVGTKGVLLGVGFALAMAASAHAEDQCNIDGKRGPEWKATFEQCLATEHCNIPVELACKNAMTSYDQFKACAEDNSELNATCMAKCNTSTKTKFNCS